MKFIAASLTPSEQQFQIQKNYNSLIGEDSQFLTGYAIAAIGQDLYLDLTLLL